MSIFSRPSALSQAEIPAIGALTPGDDAPTTPAFAVIWSFNSLAIPIGAVKGSENAIGELLRTAD